MEDKALKKLYDSYIAGTETARIIEINVNVLQEDNNRTKRPNLTIVETECVN